MIDWERVLELRDEIGLEDFQEIVDLFLTEVEHAIDEMRKGPENPTLRTEQMHFLKGAALNLGFRDLSQICQAGETAAAIGDLNAVTVGQISLMYNASKSDFLSLLPSKLAA